MKILQPNIAFGPNKATPKNTISEIYHENTKMHPQAAVGSDLIPIGNYSGPEILAMSRGHKQYANAEKILLPKMASLKANENTFDEVIQKRRTNRTFANNQLSLESFSKILQQSYGITGEASLPVGGTLKLRAVPSGGALYPAEIYLGVRNVAGVDAGIYHYNVPNHALEKLHGGDPTQTLYRVCCQQEFSQQASVVVLISGVFDRTKRKYGERGYRYVLLDTGHLGQNIYLACTSLDLPVMTTCAFFDDEANKILNLDGLNESVLYVAFIG